MNTPASAPAAADGRRAWELAARACYQEIGVPFPERVGWASSPLAGAFAAPIAACLATGHRNKRVLDSVYRAVDDTAGEPIGAAVRATVRAVAGGVSDPVHGAAATALHTEMAAAVRRASKGSAGTAPGDRPPALATALAVLGEVAAAVTSAAVDAAVGGVRQDTIRGEIRRLWGAHLRGNRSDDWLGLVGSCHPDTTPPQGAPPFEGWWWWPFRDFVVFCQGPVELRLEQAGDDEHAPHRPHRADGPGALWSDGFALYFWHGTPVPRAVIDDSLTADEILREPNAEIRRCAIERRGWDRFVAEAGLEQIGPAVPDPGNPGQILTLHHVPDGVYTTPVRVLLCTNGTVERDGVRRRFGLTVPTHCDDPIEAAAWTYGLSAAQYATAQRRS